MQGEATAALTKGLAAHKAGDLASARLRYEEALAAAPDSIDALHLYGVLLGAVGEGERGVGMLHRALELNPRFPAARFNLGCLLQQLQRSGEAEVAFRQALEVQPNFPEALLNLGNLLLVRNETDEALALLHKAVALAPGFAQAWHSLGVALREKGLSARAAEALGLAAPTIPGALAELVALADEALAAQRWAEAVDAYNRVLAVDSRRIEALCNLGNALKALDRRPEAEQAYRMALRLRPSAPILNNLAILLQEQGRIEEAIETFKAAIAADPTYAEAYASMAPALQRLYRYDEAAEACLAALRLDPSKAEAHSNLGNVRLAQNRLPEALAGFERAAQLSPGHVAFARNVAHAHLLGGDLRRGFIGYEARWKDSLQGGLRPFQAQPPWSGSEPLEGRRFFAHAEQGLGDTIQFMRYVPLLAERGAFVVLEVQAQLVDLARGLKGVGQVIARGDPLPVFDLHCPLLSLPVAFGTELGTVPAKVPYLSADPGKTAAWTDCLGRISAKPKVGLVWSGNPNHRNDHNRSVPFSALAPLLGNDSVAWVSLQKEVRSGELEAVAACGTLLDPTAELNTFSDTAALIAALDLVISVDTSVAHLAGALGKPVWVLLPFAPDWRWLLDRDDSPWYPTARLVRQTRPDDWSAPLALVGRMLANRGYLAIV